MKLLKDVIDNEYMGKIPLFIKFAGVSDTHTQVSRWIEYGCYLHRGEILRPIARIQGE